MKVVLSTNDKPWGTCFVLGGGDDYKVKKIVVNPNSRFSLQYHKKRTEHWTIVEGSGTITLDDFSEEVKPGDSFYIPVGCIHRLKGGEDGITFIEVQRGQCHEEDIVRINDDYGRVDNNTNF